MNPIKTIVRNIFSSWAGVVIQAAVVFFLTPYTISELGNERYAVWMLVTSITGHYGLLAFGFRGSITIFLTRHLATKEFERLNNAASSAFVALSTIGLVISFASIGVSILAPYIFNLDPTLKREFSICAILIGTSTGVEIALFGFSAVFTATQRFDISNGIAAATRLVSAFLIFGALKNGLGLVGVCLAVVSTNVLGALLRMWIAYKLVPQLRVSPRLATKSGAWELLSYGGWTFLSSIAQTVYKYIDTILIAAFMPVAAVTPYSLGASLLSHLESIVRPVSRVFFPVVTDLYAKQDQRGLQTTLYNGTVAILVITGVLGASGWVWSDAFFNLWVGDALSATELATVTTVFKLLLIALFARYYSALCNQILLGSLRARTSGLLALGEALFNAVLSVILIQRAGVLGVAVATIISTMLIRTVLIPAFTLRDLNINQLQFAGLVLSRPLLAILATALPAIALNRLYTPNNFGEFFLLAGTGAAIGAPFVIYFGLGSQRETFYQYVKQKLTPRPS